MISGLKLKQLTGHSTAAIATIAAAPIPRDRLHVERAHEPHRDPRILQIGDHSTNNVRSEIQLGRLYFPLHGRLGYIRNSHLGQGERAVLIAVVSRHGHSEISPKAVERVDARQSVAAETALLDGFLLGHVEERLVRSQVSLEFIPWVGTKTGDKLGFPASTRRGLARHG